MAEEQGSNGKSNEDNGSSGTRSRFSIADVSVLLASFGTMTYVLGLFALWIPIWRYYTYDFSTAWYAASLVSTTEVARFAIKQLIFPVLVLLVFFTTLTVSFAFTSRLRASTSSEEPADADPTATSSEEPVDAENGRDVWLPTVMYSLLLFTLLATLYFGWHIATSPEPLFKAPPLFIVVTVFLALYLALFLFTAVISMFSSTIHRDAGCGLRTFFGAIMAWLVIFIVVWNLFIGSGPDFQQVSAMASTINLGAVIDVFIVLIAMYITVGGVSIATAIVGLRRSEERDQSLRRFLTFPIIVFASALIAAYVISFTNKPSLPKVEVIGTQDFTGTLLTHSDGFWYLFNQEGELIAIPDNEVKSVRVYAEGD